MAAAFLCRILLTIILPVLVEGPKDRTPPPCGCGPKDIRLAQLGESQIVKSPNFPDNYCDDANCEYNIHAPDGFAIQIEFLAFQTEQDNDVVMIYDGRDANEPLMEMCSGTSCETMTTSQRRMYITFSSDAGTNERGFRAVVTVVEIPTTTTTTTTTTTPKPTTTPIPTTTKDQCLCEPVQITLSSLGESQAFTTPKFPDNYCVDQICDWIIQAPDGYAVQISWESFETESNYDIVTVYNGAVDTDPIIQECTGDICYTTTSSQQNMMVRLDSDYAVTAPGFSAVVTVVEIPTIPPTTTPDPSCNCQPVQITMTALGETETFTSPRFPDTYCVSQACLWEIQAPDGYAVQIDWKTFQTEQDYDFVVVYNGPQNSDPTLLDCSGPSCDSATSSQQDILVWFSSDYVTTEQGFMALVTVVEIPPPPPPTTPDPSCACEPVQITMTALGESQSFTSPRYPENYCIDQTCGWAIEAPDGYAVEITWKSFNTEADYDFVSVHNGALESDPMLIECTGSSCDSTASSQRNMYVKFDSDYAVTHEGFSAVVTVVEITSTEAPPPTTPNPCLCTLVEITLSAPGEQQVLTSTNFPDNYCIDQICEWTIQAPDGYAVEITWEQFDTEDQYDWVTVHDGNQMSDPTLLDCSGTSCDTATSSQSNMLVRFDSDYAVTTQGFSAILTVVEISSSENQTTTESSGGFGNATTTTTTESSGSSGNATTTTSESTGDGSGNVTTTIESSGISGNVTTTTSESNGNGSGNVTMTTESSGISGNVTTMTSESTGNGSANATTMTSESTGDGSGNVTMTTESSGISGNDTTMTSESTGDGSSGNDTTTTSESTGDGSGNVTTTTSESSGISGNATTTTTSESTGNGSGNVSTTTSESTGDGSGNVTTTTESSGISGNDTTTTSESTRDGSGNVTTTTYESTGDGSGNVTTTTESSGISGNDTTTTSESTRDGSGNVTTTTYESTGDGSGNVTTTTESSGISGNDTTTTSESTRDGSGNVTTTTYESTGDGSGNVTTTTESSGISGNVTATTSESTGDGSGNTTTTTSESTGDGSGNVTTTTESSGSSGNVTTTTTMASESTGDGSGNLTTTTESSDSSGNATTTTSESTGDGSGNVTTTTKSSGSSGNVTTTHEPSGNHSGNASTTTTESSSGQPGNATTATTSSSGGGGGTGTTDSSGGSGGSGKTDSTGGNVTMDLSSEVQTTTTRDPCLCSPIDINLNDIGDSQTFTSPHYPSDYCNTLDCLWIINAPTGYALQISWNSFNTEGDYDTVTIYDGDSTDSPLVGRCSGSDCITLAGTNDNMLVRFITDSSKTANGFSATVSVIAATLPPKDTTSTTIDSGTTDSGGAGNGTTDSAGAGTGTTDSGGAGNGTTDSGGASNGTTDSGGAGTGTTDSGGASNGTTDSGGAGNGTTDSGGAGNGTTDSGGAGTGTTDSGGAGNGTTDSGGAGATTDSTELGSGTTATTTKTTTPDPCYCGLMELMLDGPGDSESISSPRYPMSYCNNLACQWKISAPAGYSIEIAWENFDIENGYDKIKIYDGPDDANGIVLGSCTGTDCISWKANSGSMFVTFASDGSKTAPGFNAVVTVIAATPSTKPTTTVQSTVTTDSNSGSGGGTGGTTNSGSGGGNGTTDSGTGGGTGTTDSGSGRGNGTTDSGSGGGNGTTDSGTGGGTGTTDSGSGGGNGTTDSGSAGGNGTTDSGTGGGTGTTNSGTGGGTGTTDSGTGGGTATTDLGSGGGTGATDSGTGGGTGTTDSGSGGGTGTTDSGSVGGTGTTDSGSGGGTGTTDSGSGGGTGTMDSGTGGGTGTTDSGTGGGTGTTDSGSGGGTGTTDSGTGGGTGTMDSGTGGGTGTTDSGSGGGNGTTDSGTGGGTGTTDSGTGGGTGTTDSGSGGGTGTTDSGSGGGTGTMDSGSGGGTGTTDSGTGGGTGTTDSGSGGGTGTTDSGSGGGTGTTDSGTGGGTGTTDSGSGGGTGTVDPGTGGGTGTTDSGSGGGTGTTVSGSGGSGGMDTGGGTATTPADPCQCSPVQISLASLGQSQLISSPKYPDQYCNNNDCSWTITAPDDHVIQINWDAFQTESGYDLVAIYDGDSASGTLLGRCTGTGCSTILSSGQAMFVHFTSDISQVSQGFSATVTVVEQGTATTAASVSGPSLNPCEDWGLIGFAQNGNSCFRINKNRKRFSAALSDCKNYGTPTLKARLAHIPNQEVQTFLEELQEAAGIPTGFTGLQYLERTIPQPDMDQFVWSEDGSTKKADLLWQPPGVVEADFLYIFQHCSITCWNNCEGLQKWRSRHCNWPTASICEVYQA